MNLYLTLVCLPGCDDPKALFSIVAANVWPVDRLRIEEGFGGKAEVETTGTGDLFALVVIPFKLQWL